MNKKKKQTKCKTPTQFESELWIRRF